MHLTNAMTQCATTAAVLQGCFYLSFRWGFGTISAQNVISFEMLWQIFVPAVVIVIGLGLILKNGFGIDMKKRGFEVEMKGKIKAKRGKKK